MARKTLLTEGEIRQFMKLAKIPALGADKIRHFTTVEEGLGTMIGDTVKGVGGLAGGLVGDRDELEGEEVAVDELPGGEEEVGIEDEVEVEGGEGAEELVMDLLGRIEEWAEENGVSMDVEGDDVEGIEGEEELAGVEDEVAVDDMGGEEVAFGGGGEEEEEVEVAPMMEKKNKSRLSEDSGADPDHYDDNRMSDDDHIKAIEHHLEALKHDRDYDEDHESLEEGEAAIVAEVARRVARRLAGEQKNEALSDKLAERILKRLTSAK